MAPASRTVPDKRQRSIAAMFGAKEPSIASPQGTPASSSRTSSTTKPAPKASRTKAVGAQTQETVGRLPRVAFHQLPAIERSSFSKTLSEEFQALLALELDPAHGLGASYLRVLRAQLTKQYFLDLKRFLIANGLNLPRNDIFPSPKNIYLWSRATPLHQIRVVIIGQDPYHGPGQAHGLSFSVPKGIPIPGSLRNIYQELKKEYPEFKVPSHGTLHSWARSGVLLLNTSLTVKKAQAGSHSNKGWEQFTDAVVDAIDLYGGIGLANASSGLQSDPLESLERPQKRLKLDRPTDPDPDPAPPVKDSKASALAPDPKTTPPTESENPQVALNEKPSTDQPVADEPVDLGSSDQPPTGSDPQPESHEDHQAADTSSTGDSNAQQLAGFGKGVVFLCWGKWAAERVARLSESKHLILKSAHPSPLSAHRGFLGNNHFRLANDWLENKYGPAAKIDWCTLAPS